MCGRGLPMHIKMSWLGKLVTLDWKMDGVKYRTILDERLLQYTRFFKLGWKFSFQLGDNPEHTANDIME